MNRHAPFFIVVLLLILPSGYAAWSAQQKEGFVADAQGALSAARTALEDVGDYRWEFESCPPKNEAVFAEWRRRKIDAGTAVVAVEKALGVDSPEAILLGQTSLNLFLMEHQKTMKCLRRQNDYLDDLKRWRKNPDLEMRRTRDMLEKWGKSRAQEKPARR